MEELEREYVQLLESIEYDRSSMDMRVLTDHHIPILDQLSTLSGSVITVFDMSIRRHVYVSSNFSNLFGSGVDVESSSKRIHPDDYFFMLLNAIAALRFIDIHRATMRDYKFIIEYRIRSVSGTWVRVIEQQSLLESDSKCNAWLALSVLDISPDQSPCKVIKSGIIDLRSNHFLTLHDYYGTSAPILSTRELEILSLVKSGLLSKEISSRLYISVHTVNTHRQNILRKLSAVNLHEAITYASSLGLLS